MKTKKKKFLIGILTIFCLCQINLNYTFSQTWTKIPGTLDYVNSLKFSNFDKNKLYVGANFNPTDFTTNNISFEFFGDGYQVSTDGGATFQPVKLSDYSIFDFIESPSNPSKLMVSARKQDLGRILYSENGGETWDETTKRCESSSQAIRFNAVKEGDKDVFYAAILNSDNGFRYSDDYFVSCNSVDFTKINSRDIAVSKKNPSVMYLIGDNVSKYRVISSTDKGQNWTNRSVGLENYRILSVQTSPSNEAFVVVGADSVTPTGKIIGKGIFYSEDYGATWVKANGSDGASVYDIQFHPSDSRYWAAAAGDKGVFVSGTGGSYWEVVNEGLPAEYFARKVAIPDIEPTNEGIVIYASIYGNGIYKSTHVTTSVDDNHPENAEKLVYSVYPMPAKDRFSVNMNKNFSSLQYEIYSVSGIQIMKGMISENSDIDINNLSSGTYFIKFSDFNKYQVIKFNKID